MNVYSVIGGKTAFHRQLSTLSEDGSNNIELDENRNIR